MSVQDKPVKSLSRVFIERPRLAAVVAIVMAFAGILALPHLAMEEFPEIAPPQIYVSTSYAGADAQSVIETVATPIEDELNVVEGLSYYTSTCDSLGGYSCTLTFESGTNPDLAMVNVQNAVKRAEPLLPSEVQRTGVDVAKQTSSFIAIYAFTTDGSNVSPLELGDYVSRTVKDRLTRVLGVSSVSVHGAKDYAMRIWLNPVRMAALGISTEEVESAISAQNLQAAPGDIGADGANAGRTYKLTTRGRLKKAPDFASIVVRTDENGGVTRISDIDRVELGASGYAQSATLDGKEACYIDVYRQTGANALATARSVKAEMAALKKSFAPGVECVVAYDPTLYINMSLKEIVSTLFLALLAVVVITALFLQDIRATLVPCAAIPISLLATLPVLLALGYSINLLTMLGLVLVIGSLCDDAIVVTENCKTLIERDGLSPRNAAFRCMHEITGAIIATTLVTFACYVPFLFYGGMVGRLYLQFAVAMCIALGFSTIVAIVLSPVLCSLMLRPSCPSKIFAPFNAFLSLSQGAYLRVVRLLVRHGGIALAMTALCGGGIWVLSKSVEPGFIPDEDKGFCMCDIELAPGTTIARTEKVLAEFLASIRDIPSIETIMLDAGSSMMSGSGENYGSGFIQLKDWSQRLGAGESQDEIIAEVQRRADEIAEAQIACMAMSPLMDLGTTDGLEFQFCSDCGASGRTLAQAVRRFADHIRELPGAGNVTVSFTSDTPQIYLDVDRDKAQSFGVSVDGLFASLQSIMSAHYVNDFSHGGNNYHVIVQADDGFRSSPESLGELLVMNKDGAFVPLASFCTFKKRPGVRQINRFNKQSSASVTVGVASGSAAELMRRIEAMPLDPGYHVEWTGIAREQRANEGRLGNLLLLACLFAYLFLVAQYESWTLPVSILLTVLFALFGGYAALALSGATLSVYAQLGLVMLIGLAAKNAILMVEYANAKRREGLSVEDAALAGAKARYRAVMMTAWSFIVGVLPLVFSSGAGCESRQTIGLVTFCGLLVATVIGISFPPAYFALFSRFGGKR
ncbi:MAG: efflux RND transporter permease subunit [Kiritimatiellae bacterium]|nr:efflux RND transporter permease subunit [Kiritimatiellia bacterium]